MFFRASLSSTDPEGLYKKLLSPPFGGFSGQVKTKAVFILPLNNKYIYLIWGALEEFRKSPPWGDLGGIWGDSGGSGWRFRFFCRK
jgi:hypothetical protein